uniref:Sushi domain-containing protein n=1 Tax=Cyprinodon variegatus TaxID=28743 RepID=A0A3Q2DCU7_CYPVA
MFLLYLRAELSLRPSCPHPGCAIIRPPRDGGIRYRGLTQEQILPVDYEIEYICRGNRVIVGPKVRKCLPNGTWTDMTQPSRCLLLCARVWTSLENGRVTARPPGPPVEGTVLHYSCNAGFILEGRNSSHCTKLGKWDAPKPTCLCECLQGSESGRSQRTGLLSEQEKNPAVRVTYLYTSRCVHIHTHIHTDQREKKGEKKGQQWKTNGPNQNISDVYNSDILKL